MLKNESEELKVELLKKDTDISALVTRNRALESQLVQLRQERDRLLDVSSDLKVKLHQAENRQLLGRTAELNTEKKTAQDFELAQLRMSKSTDLDARLGKASDIEIGGSIIADKEADLTQLRNEVEQIRAVMSTMRASQDQHPERASTVLSHLFQSQEGNVVIPKDETPIMKRLGIMSGEF